MKQLQYTASAVPLVFSLLLDEGVRPLQTKAPAGGRPKVVELDDEGNAAGRPSTET